MENNTQAEKKHGGARAGAGRKKVDEDVLIETVSKELVFPALCSAFKADPGRFKNRYLTVDLSKSDIRAAYGTLGLGVWMRYFKQEKVGGRNRVGEGYQTKWCLHLGSYEIAKLLVESLGHTLKDLPDPGFPPKALLDRLAAIELLDCTP